MILSNHVTSQGRSEQFALYEPGTATVRYDVHVRLEPSSSEAAALMVYRRAQGIPIPGKWMKLDPEGECNCYVTNRNHDVPLRMCPARDVHLVERIAAEVWKRYGKRVPAEVLA